MLSQSVKRLLAAVVIVSGMILATPKPAAAQDEYSCWMLSLVCSLAGGAPWYQSEYCQDGRLYRAGYCMWAGGSAPFNCMSGEGCTPPPDPGPNCPPEPQPCPAE